MDNLYNIIYTLVNDINDERNAINNFFYTSNLIVSDLFSINDGLANFNVPIDINYISSNASDIFDVGLYVVGGVYVGKNLYVNGNIISNDDINIYGNLYISNNLVSNGNAIIGNVLLNGNMITSILIANNINAMNIYGNIYDLNIMNTAYFNKINVMNMDLININQIIGNQIICPTLYSNNIIVSNLVANNINITDKISGNYLVINNASNITNTLTVNGDSNILGNINVNGNIILFGNLQINNSFRVNGNFDIYGNLNLYNANVISYNNIVGNNDTYVNGNLYCENIISDGKLIGSINDIFIKYQQTLPLYDVDNIYRFDIILDFSKENKYCCIQNLNVSGDLVTTTKYLYANLAEYPYLEEFIPNVPINKNYTLTDGTNVGFNYLITGNINGNIEMLNLYYPDYIVSNSPCIRIERFNRNNFVPGIIVFNSFSISYII
jgi:cytoskeletal protein CcmA (bactofilin family)